MVNMIREPLPILNMRWPKPCVAILLVVLASARLFANNVDDVFWMMETPEQTVERIASDPLFVTARDERGLTALMNAASDSFYSGVVNVLIEAGSDVNARDPYGRTALIYAASANFMVDLEADRAKTVIHALIDAGSAIEARDHRNQTALLRAARLNPNGEAAIEALVERGADLDATDQDGRTALILAVISATRFAKSAFHDADYNEGVITALLDAGVDVGIRDDSGLTAWDYAQAAPILQSTEFYWRINDLRWD